VGGAMDLLAGAGRVIVALSHLAKDGSPKLVRECSLPLTGERRASLVVTEHATFSVGAEGLTLERLEPGSSVEWVREHTGARFVTSDTLG
jgi:3-oxoacid CoA-transferase B subunit